MKTKPRKPSPDFPLFPHASGKWAKKIDGRLRYFGRWEDPDGALAEYRDSQKPDTMSCGELTLEIAVNAFLTAKGDALAVGKLAASTYNDYKLTCTKLLKHFGRTLRVDSITPQQWSEYRRQLETTRNMHSTSQEIVKTGVVLKWCHDSGLMPSRMRFGPDFRPATKRQLRKHRRLTGPKLFTAESIHAIIAEAGTDLRAMTLLGINCGFGNNDCSILRLDSIKDGWVYLARQKTDIDRHCPLWPETLEAVQASLTHRERKPAEESTWLFVDPSGKPYDPKNSIGRVFIAVRCLAGLQRGTFYWLRHTFETIAGGSKDQVAVNYLMGHVDNSMAAVYRETIENERLQAVVDHVRAWLYQ